MIGLLFGKSSACPLCGLPPSDTQDRREIVSWDDYHIVQERRTIEHDCSCGTHWISTMVFSDARPQFGGLGPH